MSLTRFRWTRCVPCNTRCTGRPRPIPGDDFMRFRTKSYAETSCGGRGSRCEPTTAHRVSTGPPWTGSKRSTASTGSWMNCPANCGMGRIGRFRRGGCISPSQKRPNKRPLSIPAVRDRIVQAALKIVLEPIFEADFAPCSFGFRPKRGQHDALQVLVDETWRGRRWVVETECAGINRLGGGDGKALRRRSSDPRRPRVMRRCSRGCRRSVDRGTCRPGY